MRGLRCLTLFLCASLIFIGVFKTHADNSLILSGSETALRNNILITIDDCAHESEVRRMFGILRDRGVKATFFPNTRYLLQQDPTVWQEIVAAGFEIGYHTRWHQSWLTADELAADFAQFQEEIRTILGNPSYQIRYVRPPNGAWDQTWLDWAAANNLMTVRWNIVPPMDDAMLIGTLRHPNGGGIFLIHVSYTDADWLDAHIDSLISLRDEQDHPYIITTLTEALND